MTIMASTHVRPQYPIAICSPHTPSLTKQSASKEATLVQTIMVPLDGSALSAQALHFATSLAKRTQATLHLVHVHVPLSFSYAGVGVNGTVFNSWEIDNQQRTLEAAYLDGHRQRIAEEYGIVTSSEVLEGPVVEMLVAFAATAAIDLVVMSTHGRGPLVRFWLGSVTDGMIRRTTTPLLIIRPHEQVHIPAKDASFQSVLLPLDGSVLAEQAIDPVLALVHGTDCRITLMRVVVPHMEFSTVTAMSSPDLDHQDTKMRELEAKRYLEQVAKRIKSAGAETEIRIIFADQSASTILSEAQDNSYDLVAISTHGWGGLKRLLIGSVADKLVRGIHCPLLVVRPEHTVEAAE